MCTSIQSHLPLDNSLLTNLVYIDPLKEDDEKTEEAVKEICDKMSNYIKPEEKDSVIAELRLLACDLGEDYPLYCEKRMDDSIAFKDVPRIDQIWSPIIKILSIYPLFILPLEQKAVFVIYYMC